MRKSAIKFLVLGMVSMALASAPVIKAYASGDDNPSAPAMRNTSQLLAKVESQVPTSETIWPPKYLR